VVWARCCVPDIRLTVAFQARAPTVRRFVCHSMTCRFVRLHLSTSPQTCRVMKAYVYSENDVVQISLSYQKIDAVRVKDLRNLGQPDHKARQGLTDVSAARLAQRRGCVANVARDGGALS
jgi:predicted DNA-binding protein (UPF0251 family)